MVFWWKRESGKISRRSTINPVKTPFQLLDPEGLFQRYDKDSSGNISFDEFKDMLPDLGIKISDAKALKYFKGEIISYFICQNNSYFYGSFALAKYAMLINLVS